MSPTTNETYVRPDCPCFLIIFGRSQDTAFIASRFVFIFPCVFWKRKEITDAVTHLLVLPFALMENVKGAQPRWGQADIANERRPSHKTDVYCFSKDDLFSAPCCLRSNRRLGTFQQRCIAVGRTCTMLESGVCDLLWTSLIVCTPHRPAGT